MKVFVSLEDTAEGNTHGRVNAHLLAAEFTVMLYILRMFFHKLPTKKTGRTTFDQRNIVIWNPSFAKLLQAKS